MNIPVHAPHWDTTDDEGAVHVRIHPPVMKSHARMTAAIIGMTIAVIAGLFLYVGRNGLFAQLSDTGQLLQLTDEGMNPATISLQRGEQITLLNQTNIPHIIAFDTLLDENGILLQSPAIFPDTDWTFIIPENTMAGAYSFASQTSSMIQGEVIVTDLETDTTDVVSLLDDLNVSDVQDNALNEPTENSSVPDNLSFDAASSRSFDMQNIDDDDAYNAATNSLDASDSALPVNPNIVGSPLHGAAEENIIAPESPRPFANPSTGMAEWTVYLSLGCAFFLVFRKALRIR